MQCSNNVLLTKVKTPFVRSYNFCRKIYDLPKLLYNFVMLKYSRVVSVLAFHSGGREFKAWPGRRSFDSPVPVGSQTPVEFDACYSDGT